MAIGNNKIHARNNNNVKYKTIKMLSLTMKKCY